jgi:hypothetical protein
MHEVVGRHGIAMHRAGLPGVRVMHACSADAVPASLCAGWLCECLRHDGDGSPHWWLRCPRE